MGRPVQSLIHAAQQERMIAGINIDPAAGMSQVPSELELKLVAACRVLKGADLQKAQSLLDFRRRRGAFASAAQENFARSLCNRAKPAPVPQEREKVALGNFSAMVALFDRAASQKSAKAFRPKVRLMCEETTIELTVAGANAAQPGTINVATPGGYGVGKWFGRITKEGEFEINPREKSPSALRVTLGEFARNPLDSMVSYGRLLGQCSLCGRALKDPISIERGIGPICLSRFMGE